MDKLAERLRDDAARIDATVSERLDHRIRASLEAIEPETPGPTMPGFRPAAFWWASSLTGIAAAAALIVIVNMRTPAPPPPAVAPLALPHINLRARTAVLTRPLEAEIADLQSDLRKAEEAVKRDIDRLF